MQAEATEVEMQREAGRGWRAVKQCQAGKGRQAEVEAEAGADIRCGQAGRGRVSKNDAGRGRNVVRQKHTQAGRQMLACRKKQRQAWSRAGRQRLIGRVRLRQTCVGRAEAGREWQADRNQADAAGEQS
jgi:hypothetical protein